MLRLTCLLISLAAAPISFAQSQTETYASTTTFTFTGTSLPTGLIAANYTVKKPAKNTFTNISYTGYTYSPSNVYIRDGFLNLRVPGGQAIPSAGGNISSAQIFTKFTISSARVETYAILTNVAGVCNGMFYYANDTQEMDIEWISDARSLSNSNRAKVNGVARSLFYTNQASVAGGTKTLGTGGAPCGKTKEVHNYRIDWNSSATTFYVDREKKFQFGTNVPTSSKGKWVWNNWSNGEPGWSVGPPVKDAIFRIQRIVMYYDPGS